MADFSILKQQIAAALPENTEGEITATIMVAQFWAAIDAINTAKADQGDLDALAGVVAGKQDALTLAAPLAFSSNGALILNYSGHGITLDADGNLGVEAGSGLGFVDSTLVVDYGDGLTTEEDTSTLIAKLGDGLAFDPNGAIVPDFAFVQAAISDLVTIRSGAAAGATAVQPADVSDCVRSASVSTIVTLSQAEYDDLTNYDANTFYIII